MFSATYFTYDGVFSGQYGLMLADFEDNSVVETTAFSPVLNTVKPAQLNRFIHTGITYENPPQHQFSIISEAPISDVLRREVLSWLVGRDSFKKLQIHQADLENYYYNCVFTDTDIIYVNGRCHGFRVTANFDSFYAYGRPNETTIQYPYDFSAGLTHWIEFDINNVSDTDGYVYPTIEIDGIGQCYNTSGINVRIINATDDPEGLRPFVIRGLTYRQDRVIIINNETRTICDSSNDPSQILAGFNKNWLRLRKGKNTLKVSLAYQHPSVPTMRIICPTYASIGF